ncbi:MAG: DUF5615 family PIN-like protein [Fimbriimonadaceae bacterium]
MFDANLSPKLVGLPADVFPGACHVESIGLKSSDRSVWDFALRERLPIVTKDGDFEALAVVQGPPIK